MGKKPTPTSPVISLSKVKPIEFVTSGVPEIDSLVGGFPRGRMTQIYGLSGIGKTSLMILCLAALSKSGEKVLYIDAENATNVQRIEALGADLEKIDYTNISVLEEVAELVRDTIHKYGVIVVDSIAMLTPRAEQSGETGEAHVGLKPRLIGQWLREITEPLGNSTCALVFINQMRRNMQLYAETYILPGGMQLKFSSALMLELKTAKADQVVENGERIGHWINVTVTKSKVSRPYQSTKFKLLY